MSADYLRETANMIREEAQKVRRPYGRDEHFTLAVADLLEQEAVGDGLMPHCYPKDAPAEAISWACQACGGVIYDWGSRGACSVDWRPRSPQALAIARAWRGDA